MKILQINKFFYPKGGPERYMFNISRILKRKDHVVAFFSMKNCENIGSEWGNYFVNNVDYGKKHSLMEQIRIFKNTLYSHEAEKKLSKLIDNFKPEIAHVHNFNHQLTPSILFVLKKKNIPIVMTMHDYKLVCPSYLMLNRGRVCELCKGKKFYQSFRTGCHKNSYSKSFLVMLESYLHHQILHSYRHIKYFICPSKFIMNEMQKMGLKGNFTYIPNFINSKNEQLPERQKNNKLIYWGRLSGEKGIETLIDAVKEMSAELEIIGDGPLKDELERKIKAEKVNNIKLLGYLKGNDLFNKIRESYVAIMPSEWYENNPLSILEAFALGKPVIGSRIGGIPELVKDEETGLLFEPGNAEDLRSKIKYLLSSPDKVAQMSRNVRILAEKEYSSELHYERLIKTYNNTIAMSK